MVFLRHAFFFIKYTTLILETQAIFYAKKYIIIHPSFGKMTDTGFFSNA